MDAASEATTPSPEAIETEHRTRERLGVALTRLAALRPRDLVHPPHSNTNFRGGLPYFERTLGLFRRLAGEDLRGVPSEYLKIVADDAEQALNQFHEILNFTGDNLENPDKVRGEIITEVRDAYRPIYEDVALIIKTPIEELERIPRAWSGVMLVVGLAALILGAAAIALEYSSYYLFVDKVVGALSVR